jgi:hypothetical protein
MPADTDGRLLRIVMTRSEAEGPRAERDLSARGGSFAAIWLAPIALAGLLNLIAPQWSGAAWGLAFVWMGGACLLNARRCGRLHCFFSGPILLIGAAVLFAVAGGALDFMPLAIVAVTLGLAALTFGLERLWGRYRRA